MIAVKKNLLNYIWDLYIFYSINNKNLITIKLLIIKDMFILIIALFIVYFLFNFRKL